MPSHETSQWSSPIVSLLANMLIVPLILSIPSAIALNPHGSRQAAPDLICHSSNPAECYPRIFEPTSDFQTVHDDQELPNGLHVRINMQTGAKEAKLNVPGEEVPGLAALPVEQAVIVVDGEQADVPRIPKGAPQYESTGKVKKPPQESETFNNLMRTLRSASGQDDGAADEALDGLEDISHNMYYGLKLTEDADVVKTLLCLMTNPTPLSNLAQTPKDQRAASVLVSALQNNPPALREVAKSWKKLMGSICPNAAFTIHNNMWTSAAPSSHVPSDGAKVTASRVKAKVSAMSSLIKDSELRREFLTRDGMQGLLEVLLQEGDEWATAQRRVGQLVLDNFLDEDMGATLGEWPRTPRLSDQECRSESFHTAEGCWDYHVDRILHANRGRARHWSREFHERLAAARSRGPATTLHEDL